MAKEAPVVAVAGLGLIGGSLAMALKSRWPRMNLLGVDVKGRLDQPKSAGLFSSLFDTRRIKDAVKDADYVFLCAPQPANLDLLLQLRSMLKPGCILSDVSALKREICQVGRKLYADAQGPWFIGGHPLSGRELSGFGAASPDLFRGRTWAICEASTVPPARLSEFKDVMESTGAVLREVDARVHDEAMVTVSHLPQLVSTALMLTASGRDAGLAGTALLDMTRLATSSPATWNPVLLAERQRVVSELQRLRAYLTELEIALAFNEPLTKWFELAAKARESLVKATVATRKAP
ncbi:prephenate dehydrogenase/arogenate dehydrogenase family protein [bacterium]|nr:MAG: prephenate dehydrogenase/arogenate dehydrogenase family protein [bacterium]